jgi:pSer/pThr/pTyr-binding forkhead associated (FHA) protein
MLTILMKFNDKLLKTVETDKDTITIGRNVTNDIQIENLSVSKQHAKISKIAGKFHVEDLNSTNGTYLNEKMISINELKHKDIITIGKHTLEVLFEKKESSGSAQENINDTMMLTTEKHKEMLKKQKK